MPCRGVCGCARCFRLQALSQPTQFCGTLTVPQNALPLPTVVSKSNLCVTVAVRTLARAVLRVTKHVSLRSAQLQLSATMRPVSRREAILRLAEIPTDAQPSRPPPAPSQVNRGGPTAMSSLPTLTTGRYGELRDANYTQGVAMIGLVYTCGCTRPDNKVGIAHQCARLINNCGSDAIASQPAVPPSGLSHFCPIFT